MYKERSADIKVRGDEGIGGVGGFTIPAFWGGSCTGWGSACFRRAATFGEAGAALGVNCEDRTSWIAAHGSAC
jgi:hypothetical protein